MKSSTSAGKLFKGTSSGDTYFILSDKAFFLIAIRYCNNFFKIEVIQQETFIPLWYKEL